MPARPSTVHAPVRVAEPSASFWIVKVLITAMGESVSDFLVRAAAPELVVPLALLALAGVLTLQLRTHRYRPAVYWSTAGMVAVFGTMAADVLHVALGVPYAASTAGFAAALAAVFAVWWRTQHGLSVHDVTTARGERCYWAAVICTFALGTAAGDLTATATGLGYLGSGVLFLVLFAVPGIVLAVTGRFPVAAFWTAYVLTRPLGASFADWAAVDRGRGGLGAGPGPVSAVLLAVLVALVAALVVQQRRARGGVATRSAAP